MTGSLRPEVPFPAAGEGIFLKFSNPDCDELQKRFGEDWFTGSFDRLNKFDIAFFRACVEVGARRDGKKTVVKFDDIEAPMMQIGEPIVDALYVCIHGKTFGDFLVDQGKKAEALEQAANPTNVSSLGNISAS